MVLFRTQFVMAGWLWPHQTIETRALETPRKLNYAFPASFWGHPTERSVADGGRIFVAGVVNCGKWNLRQVYHSVIRPVMSQEGTKTALTKKWQSGFPFFSGSGQDNSSCNGKEHTDSTVESCPFLFGVIKLRRLYFYCWCYSFAVVPNLRRSVAYWLGNSFVPN